MDEKNLYTFENPVFKDTYRHTTSHILAQAVKRLYPEVKLAIGPAIADGFYYDFDAPFAITPEILEKLEAAMTKAFQGVYDLAQEKNLYMRDAAYVISINRVGNAIKTRGWV